MIFFFVLQILFCYFSTCILIHDKENRSILLDYISTVRYHLINQYNGKFASIILNHFFIVDNRTEAETLCQLIPSPCVTYGITDLYHFVGLSQSSMEFESSDLIITSLNEKEFNLKNQNFWIPEILADVRIVDHSQSSELNFIVDSGASLSYINEADAIDLLAFRNLSDCLYYINMSGLLETKVNLCVVEVIIEINGENYLTFAQIGNSNTTKTNLLGRLKLFNYFEISMNALQKKILFKENVTPQEKRKIRRDEL